jgi:hypothetical protein
MVTPNSLDETYYQYVIVIASLVVLKCFIEHVKIQSMVNSVCGEVVLQ